MGGIRTQSNGEQRFAGTGAGSRSDPAQEDRLASVLTGYRTPRSLDLQGECLVDLAPVCGWSVGYGPRLN